jgi:hypothetical protein
LSSPQPSRGVVREALTAAFNAPKNQLQPDGSFSGVALVAYWRFHGLLWPQPRDADLTRREVGVIFFLA